MTYLIRPATPADMTGLTGLCRRHAEYERAGPPAPDLGRRLDRALFGDPPALGCLILCHGEQAVGYATFTEDFSTWRGDRFLHLDCLFVDIPHRGAGRGGQLFDAIAAVARSRGIGEMQWQTPDWNTDAQRFYQRRGAQGSAKTRYTLGLG